MINNITNVDTHLPMSTAKAGASRFGGMTMPPLLSFKTPLKREKAELRVQKFKRKDNILIDGIIDDDYIEIVEEETDETPPSPIIQTSNNFFASGGTFTPPQPNKKKLKFLKTCYVIDYIQSPICGRGLGTEALKGLAEKAFFDKSVEGRIVTYSAPVCEESSPALFFYKLGFRFLNEDANEYIKECLIKNIPDIPVQKGMMFLPRKNLHKLLRYGEKF